MANNRLWLIHKPSKLGIMLGKRMAGEWYKAPENTDLERFYQYLYDQAEGDQDDLTLAMETCTEGGVSCFNDWTYTADFENGFRVFEFT